MSYHLGLLLIAVSLTGTFTADFTIDLSTGVVTDKSPHVSLYRSLANSYYTGAKWNCCKKSGQLRIYFGAYPPKTKAMIELKLFKPRSWVYHMSDMIYANGWGGTTGSEVQGLSEQMSVYTKHYPSGYLNEVINRNQRGGLTTNILSTFHRFEYAAFNISANRVEYTNFETHGSVAAALDAGILVSDYLFPSVHSTGDRSIWLGMNRVNSATRSRQGVGLCEVKITMF